MSLTAANAVIMLSIPGLFPAPQQLQGFAADDVADTDAVQSVETSMGVDGVLSGGFVFAEVRQNYALQADSESNFIFDQWYATQQQTRSVFTAQGVILIPDLARKWTMVKGFLGNFKPVPDIKKKIEARRFTITWQNAQFSPV